MLLVLMLWTGCSDPPDPDLFQGYVEGEYIHVASPIPGALDMLHVRRGDTIRKGAPLFVLERSPQFEAMMQSSNLAAQAHARVENLRKGRRPEEIKALEARLDQNTVSLKLSEIEWKRIQNLHNSGVVSIGELDRARAARDLLVAQSAEMRAELALARLGAREDEVRAAEAEWEAAKAALRRDAWNWSQKEQFSPADGLVHDTLYLPGELVGAGRPVVVLLPPTNLMVRFFVPESRLGDVRPDSRVMIQGDGFRQPLKGTVHYVSTRAEFTPPVIYSQQTRAKLVFMVEARFDTPDTSGLLPGKPVDVRLAP